MCKGIGKILSACLLLLVVTGGITRAAVFTYTDETAYLNDLAAFGYSSFVESFEDDAVWGGLRSTITSKITAPSVTSQGIVWTSNHPASNDITTGNGAAVTGEWGIYDPLHGVATGNPQECDVDNPPEKCLDHDGVSGTWAVDGSVLYGIGGWLSGTSGANIEFVLNQDPIGLGKLGLPGQQPQFFGVIDTLGFVSYMVREIDGKVGDALYIFGDDFTFAVSALAPCTPTGVPDDNCDGVDDDCSGTADDGYVPVADCGVGLCLTNNTPSSCVNGVEILCKSGDPVPENRDPVCTDALDNDCDGLVDAEDSGCSEGPVPPCTPTGVPDDNCDGVDDDCSGTADDGYVPVADCGVGLCLTNNTPSSCVNGVEILCKSGDPVPENRDPVCTDALDNDCDGLVDAEDSGCSGERKFSWTMYLPAILGTGLNRGK